MHPKVIVKTKEAQMNYGGNDPSWHQTWRSKSIDVSSWASIGACSAMQSFMDVQQSME
jgi:hypothetical protein